MQSLIIHLPILYDLTLLIPGGKNNLDFNEILDYYFNSKKIDFETK